MFSATLPAPASVISNQTYVWDVAYSSVMLNENQCGDNAENGTETEPVLRFFTTDWLSFERKRINAAVKGLFTLYFYALMLVQYHCLWVLLAHLAVSVMFELLLVLHHALYPVLVLANKFDSIWLDICWELKRKKIENGNDADDMYERIAHQV